MGRIVGIDIGSTNCVVAVADEPDHGGHACLRVVEIDGCGEIPCVIALGSDRRIVVGDRAKKLAARGVPENGLGSGHAK